MLTAEKGSGQVALTTTAELLDLHIDQPLHLIVFDDQRTKNHRGHVSYYSEETARLIRSHLAVNIIQSDEPIFPQYQRLWKQITHYSRSIGTYLKSHHLRKRFTHIAERTPLPIPDINYLMGNAKKGVHCAEAYSYTIEDELAEAYRKFLLPFLGIANHRQRVHLVQDLDAGKESRELYQMLKQANSTIETLTIVIDSLASKISH